MIIYTEATEKPDGWVPCWIGNENMTVVWGYIAQE